MPPSSSIDDFRAILRSAKKIIILSGAGLSAPSGIQTYRGSGDKSLWSNPNAVKYSKHTTFEEDPSGSWQFYHHRRLECLKANPNKGHLALAALNIPSVASRVIPSATSVPLHVTQNLDELAVRALRVLPESSNEGQNRLIQIHGSLFRTRCRSCKHEEQNYKPYLRSSMKKLVRDEIADIAIGDLPRCGGDEWVGSNRYGRCGGLLRPDVVWFGEVPPRMGEIGREMTACDLLIVVGTSSIVQPAAGFASQVQGHSGKVAVFNLDRSNNDDKADFLFLGSCDTTLPEVLDVGGDIAGFLGFEHRLANAMYYPQQSPGIQHKLSNHHDTNPWRLPMLVQQPGQQSSVGPPPPSPGYALYNNGAIQHHPGHHPLQHPPLQHHHQSSMSHYPSPPNQHTHQQQHLIAAQGSPASTTPVATPQWQQQLMKCEMVRASRSPHHRARASAMASRTVAKSAIPITNPNLIKPPPTPEQSNGGMGDGSPDGSPVNGNGVVNSQRPSTPGLTTEISRPTAIKPPENTWTSLDMGGVNIKNLPPTSGLFSFTFLINLYLNHNALSSVPLEISRLRHLELLDLSGNNLSTLPPELGMLSQLKEFYLFDNQLTTIPPQFGSLHQLQTLGIEGNPLDPLLKTMVQKDGTRALITYLRDNCPVETDPPERVWKHLIPPQDQDVLAKDPNVESVSIMCYNILCERCATEKVYGYTPSWALAWSYRKGRILDEILKHDVDIICLQEMDIAQYEDYFTANLSQHGYEGVFWPKSRYKTMKESDRRLVDGCATFYKSDKYKLVEKHLLEFSALAMQRQDFKKTDDMFNRVLGKDHLAVICLLENKHTGSRLIVANTHIHWDAAYRDVKLVQVALLVEEVEKIAHHFAKYPPPPPGFNGIMPPSSEASASSGVNGIDDSSDAASTSASAADESSTRPSPTPAPVYRPPPIYTDGSKIPTIVCGDFNSLLTSGVYEFLNTGSVPPTHEDFMSHTYGRYTSEGIRHRLGLKSAYSAPGAPAEALITNHTPTFKEHIDYVWYSAANMGVNKVLGEIDPAYLDKVVGFPNPHFPSDHVAIAAEFRIKPPRETAPSRQPSTPTSS
uniref:CCR4-Not complex 3'-5'-exoribonuclease subunit Ccr4 n=1 Tax=Psilocybe cubensis TaxID=181762 RepID=A0A8H7Y6Z8_PSICU